MSSDSDSDHRHKKKKSKKSKDKKKPKHFSKYEQKTKTQFEKQRALQLEQNQFRRDVNDMLLKMTSTITSDLDRPLFSNLSQQQPSILDQLLNRSDRDLSFAESTFQFSEHIQNPEQLDNGVPMCFRDRMKLRSPTQCKLFNYLLERDQVLAPDTKEAEKKQDKKHKKHKSKKHKQKKIDKHKTDNKVDIQALIEKRRKDKEEKRDEIRKVKIMKELEKQEQLMNKIRVDRIKRKRMNEFKSKVREALRNRKTLEPS